MSKAILFPANRIDFEKFKISTTARELYFGVLARTALDGCGPVPVPTICRDGARELVKAGIAEELGIGNFILKKGAVELIDSTEH